MTVFGCYFYMQKNGYKNIFCLRVWTKHFNSTKKKNYENNKNFKIEDGNVVTTLEK